MIYEVLDNNQAFEIYMMFCMLNTGSINLDPIATNFGIYNRTDFTFCYYGNI